MASTKNINTRGNYNLETRFFERGNEYLLNPEKRYAHQDAYPCFGVNVGGRPLDTLSHNGVDVESALFGINSTNLVNPQQPVKMQAKHMPNVQFFERNKAFLPEPLVVVNKQRPFPVPK